MEDIETQPGSMESVPHGRASLEVLLPSPGDRIDRFVVRGVIGRGAMGVVLRAFDEELDRVVALKFVHPGAGKFAQRWRQRLRREAQALARIAHPNVVAVHFVGEHRGLTYVAMDHVEGISLAQWLRNTPQRPWRQVVQLFLQVGDGLAAAHAAGLVHRDFKPDNALIDDQGRARVLDFGLAADRSAESGRALWSLGTSEEDAFEPNLTHDGAMLGTPRYAPPEQHLGAEVDARADQFSFCLTLYEALARRHPFGDASTRAGWALAISSGRTPPRSSSIPARVYSVLARGLRQDAADRFGNMDELLAALRLTMRRRTWPVIVGGTVLATMAALGWPTSSSVGPACNETVLPGWLDARRDAREWIVEHPVPYAGAAADAVQTLGDEFAARWANDTRSVCERKRSGELEAQDAFLMRRCLDSEAQRFIAILDQLETVESAALFTVPGRIPIAADLAQCRDLESLRRQTNPDVAQDVALRLDAELARLSALSALASPETCTQVAEEVRAHAVEAGSTHDASRALELHAQCSFRAGDYETALESSREAYFELTALGDGTRAARSAQLCASVLRRTGGDLDRAQEWVNNARAQATRAAPHLLPSIERTAATIAGRKQEWDVAEQRLRTVIEGQDTTADDRAAAMSDLGTTLHRAGKGDEALVWVERGATSFSERYGDGHPQTASTLMNLATMLNAAGHNHEAAGVGDRSVQAMRSLYGASHQYYAFALQTRGSIHHGAGELEAAAECYDEACTTLVAAQTDEARRRACVVGAATIAMSLGDAASARRWASSVSSSGGDGDSVKLRAALAWALAQSGDLQRAAETLSRGDEERETAWVNLARAAIAAGRGDRAAAMGLAESVDAGNAGWMGALATRQLADLLVAEGAHEQAVTAVQARSSQPGIDPIAAAILERWLDLHAESEPPGP